MTFVSLLLPNSGAGPASGVASNARKPMGARGASRGREFRRGPLARMGADAETSARDRIRLISGWPLLHTARYLPVMR